MAFYDNFCKSILTPKQYWVQGMQEKVNQEFENASTVEYDVEEEIRFGSLEFAPVECRITSLVDAKTGQRVNDDYKKIIYNDLNKKPELGTRYRFDNNIWMVFSTDNLKTVTSSAYLRRCNNTLNIEDKYGLIHHEPCYIDYSLTETQPYKEYTMDVPSGRIGVTCQLNQHTQDIGINRRFVFNDNVYKIRERHKFDRQYTFDKDSAKTLSFYADVDAIADADRMDIGVADYFDPMFVVETVEEIKNVVGFSDKLHHKVLFMDDTTDESVFYETSDDKVCKINQYNGKFECVGVGTCKLYCRMFNNPKICSVTNVEVVATQSSVAVDIISPEVTYLKLNQKQQYSIYSYLDGVQLDTKFDIQAYDIPENYFDLESDGNNFAVLYHRLYSDGILKIVCTNLDTGEKTILLLELGGIW